MSELIKVVESIVDPKIYMHPKKGMIKIDRIPEVLDHIVNLTDVLYTHAKKDIKELLDGLDYIETPFSGGTFGLYTISSEIGQVCIGRFPAGFNSNPHFHNGLEIIRILDGKGIFIKNEEGEIYGKGDKIYIPKKMPHYIETRTPTYIFSICTEELKFKK